MVKLRFNQIMEWLVLFLLGVSFIGVLIDKVFGLFLFAIFVFLVYKYKKIPVLSGLKSIKQNFAAILLTAFILRLLWVLIIPTKPISDFGLMYGYAQKVAQGDYSGFHGYGYFARFAHDTVTVLYFSLFYKFSSAPLFSIKIANVLFSTFSVFLLYKVVEKIYDDRQTALVSMLLYALYLPSIMYNSQTMQENIATSFYLLSTYYFLAAVKNQTQDKWDKVKLLVFCGLGLAVGHMFRMVGYIFLLAYLFYYLFYKRFKNLVIELPFIIISCLVPIIILSSLLVSSGITETQLWNSKEPYWTSILKGTNIEAYGHWNLDDAEISELYKYDPVKITEASKQIIKDRLLNTPKLKLLGFSIIKFESEWAVPDMSAYIWTIPGAVDYFAFAKFFAKSNLILTGLASSFYLILLFMSILGLHRNKDRPVEINFFLILYLGYALFLMLIEAQARYAYMLSWIFIIFAAGGVRLKDDTVVKVYSDRSIEY
ncbi:undecaprenyl phosphate-alpha-4-amino-4-deoxy-L-arabinose arabinosyl transferase [Desulfosporosinus acididurans]|uniref:Undecaprenyl phosphate-alpha-4-amino-4-deoxy-L-arabinose arabinosyl transferase n=1 Tax=Desulfosporosinus acididurans TaxID=476652 RepID=A0A0J1FK38_9FIRM|nr:glycosyltransferase family 39 protein [Desulfosporosinus acididurans]KLU63844.1 undecaprenyl phosphate-alpha-4-amino-4-deoxy-L-arabinose arabinosyl transferase [Desulfosporosinus acididurans]